MESSAEKEEKNSFYLLFLLINITNLRQSGNVSVSQLRHASTTSFCGQHSASFLSIVSRLCQRNYSEFVKLNPNGFDFGKKNQNYFNVGSAICHVVPWLYLWSPDRGF